MKRNKQTEKLKALRRLRAESRAIWHRDTRGYNTYDSVLYSWIPVDKPQFIGWESVLEWDPLILRNPNAGELKELLEKIGGRKPVFFKNTDSLGCIRAAKRNYLLAKELYWKKFWKPGDKNKKSLDGVRCLDGYNLNEREYEALPEHLKKYFSVWTRIDLWSGKPYNTYQLNYLFPKRWLNIKVDKAYSTHRGIPKADIWRRDKEIDDVLDHEHYFCAKNGFRGYSWSSYEGKAMGRRLAAKKWKVALRQFNDEESLEYFEAKTFKRV